MHSYQLSYVCITILVFLTTANEWVVYILNEPVTPALTFMISTLANFC